MKYSILDAALDLSRRGFAVFPIKPKNKIPATNNGFKAASRDLDEVERLFSGKENYNIGIATGPVSGFWVLDLDGQEGIAALAHLELNNGKLPETVSSRTGGGGRHLFFKCNGDAIKNRAKINGDQIDVRGAGGYVVAPPSEHSSGKPYTWEHDPESTPIAEAPDWLVDLVTGRLTSDTSVNSGLTFTIGEDLDLATDRGASKGQRHQRATQLIGSAIARGVDLCQVADQAVRWAAKCSPAMDNDEVLKIVQDFSQRQRAKNDSAREESEQTPLPESSPWPTLEEAAYHGLAGEIVRTIEPQSEADPAALLVQLLVMFGNLLGRDPHYLIEGTSHHTNLFAVLVGATSRGRKGTSEGRVREILRFVDEDWLTDRVVNGLVSGEGLVWNVRDEIYKREPVKENGLIVGHEETLVDSGVDDKRLLVIESEFASILRVCRREQNTLSPTLRSAWDSGNLRTLAKNSPAKATGAHISICGHITEEELKRSLTEVESYSGFANRFLWLAVRRSKLLPDGGEDLDLSRFAVRLKEAADEARLVDRMRRDQAAAKLWRDIYVELATSEAGGLLGAVTSRSEAQVLRLSMLYALLDQSSTISVDHLKAAYAVWRYAEASARRIFGDSTGDPLADKVLSVIREHPKGIARWDIHQAIGKHIRADLLVGSLARLRDTGRARVETIPTGGRSAETWFPNRAQEETEVRVKRVSDLGFTSLTSNTSGAIEGFRA